MHRLIEKHINEFFRDITGFGGIWFYLLFLLFGFLVFGADFVLSPFVVLVVIYAVAVFVRVFYFKDRPFHELHRNFFERIDASSFPSIHAARATALAYFISGVFSNATWLAVVVAFFVCVSRIYLRKHYLVDVIGGIILGALAAFTITNFLV